MKKILILLISILTVFLIFILAKDQKIDYLSIGDTLTRGINSYNVIGTGYNDYLKNYLRKNDMLRNFNDNYYNNSIISFTEDIKNNKTVIINDKEYYLKKILRESDLLVISIGMDELAYYFDMNNIENIYIDFDKMILNINDFIEEVTNYAKNDIVFIGYYNPTLIYNSDIDELFCYIDDELNKLLKNYDIEYISIYEEIKNGNYLLNGNYHLNSKGYLIIANKIIDYIERNIL